jgi:hypothetical protein
MTYELSESASPLPYTADLVSPAEMPPPAVYDREYQYWPWGDLIMRAVEIISAEAPPGAAVTDYMCATGMLLQWLTERRPDVSAGGCDIHLPFVQYANETRPALDIAHADARGFRLSNVHDVIACTGSLHHLPFPEQGLFVESLRRACHQDTLVVFGEAVLRSGATENERVRSALDLNSELISLGIERGWPPDLLSAGLLILRNDVLLLGEYKRDLEGWLSLIEPHFRIEELVQTWVPKSGGGDYLFVCRPR